MEPHNIHLQLSIFMCEEKTVVLLKMSWNTSLGYIYLLYFFFLVPCFTNHYAFPHWVQISQMNVNCFFKFQLCTDEFTFELTWNNVPFKTVYFMYDHMLYMADPWSCFCACELLDIPVQWVLQHVLVQSKRLLTGASLYLSSCNLVCCSSLRKNFYFN